MTCTPRHVTYKSAPVRTPAPKPQPPVPLSIPSPIGPLPNPKAYKDLADYLTRGG